MAAADRINRFSTSNVSDALDRQRIRGGLEGILPISDGLKICGTAFTVRWVTAEQSERKPWPTYIDQAKPGDVVVIDNGGRMNCTVWGDLLTSRAQKAGVRGTVINGVCRDVKQIRELGYAVFSRGRFMMTGKDRLQLDSVNKPVSISDVLVSPGDLILADDNGVVCIPRAKVNEVLSALEEIGEREAGIAEALSRGVPLTEARKQFGYGELQRPKD
ncbi:MAG: RraA family protein [Thaumarchaeota archaeon]|nr:RraA family protein [Nitrososphaerota archaeon]